MYYINNKSNRLIFKNVASRVTVHENSVSKKTLQYLVTGIKRSDNRIVVRQH